MRLGSRVAMATNDYHFISQWRVESTREEVYEVLGDAAGLAQWWPSVYITVDVLSPGDANGVGKRVKLHSKGKLPYTIRWEFVVSEVRRPEGFSLIAFGDFVGTGA